jgi:hypothetical protein
VLSTGTPHGSIAMNRVCEPVAIPDRFTCNAVAPDGTSMKYDTVELRCTDP